MSDSPKLTPIAIYLGGAFHSWSAYKVEGFNNLYLVENPDRTAGHLCAYDTNSNLWRLDDCGKLRPECSEGTFDLSGYDVKNADPVGNHAGVTLCVTRDDLLEAIAPYAQA